MVLIPLISHWFWAMLPSGVCNGSVALPETASRRLGCFWLKLKAIAAVDLFGTKAHKLQQSPR